MADNTPTANLRLRKQMTARNRGIWGVYLNENLDKIDQIFGLQTINVTGGTYVLQQEDYEEDETTSLVMKLNGTLTSALQLIVPQLHRPFFIWNNTTGAFNTTLSTGGGTPLVIPQGGTIGVLVDGVNVTVISQSVTPSGGVLGTSVFTNITVLNEANLNDVNASGDVGINGTLIVEGETNLQNLIGQNAGFAGTVSASGLQVSGNTILGDTLASSLLSHGNLTVQGSANFGGAIVGTNMTLSGNLAVSGDISVLGTLNVANFAITNFAVSNLTVSGAATLTTLSVSGASTFSTAITLPGDPTGPLEAVTKQYVDALASGIQWKSAVKVATTGAITLSGTQTIDGVGVTGGDRVLVKDQGDSVENGIYVVSAGAWDRSLDADTDVEIANMVCFVTNGTAHGGESWILSNANATIAGPKVYVLFSASTAEVDWSVEAW